MKKIMLAVGIVAIAGMLIVATSFAADGGLKIAGLSGKVLVKIAPSTEWVAATADTVLKPSDAIKTEENSAALLEFSDKSTVALKQKTEVLIEELAWTDASRKAGLKMSIGELRAILKKTGTDADFKVKTPTAICGARGTIFYVMTTGTETRVFVTEGSVDFTNPESGNTYVVVQNMAAISELSGSVSEPRELTGDEKEQALAGWDGVIAETYTDPSGNNSGNNDPSGDGDTQEIAERPAESPASPI